MNAHKMLEVDVEARLEKAFRPVHPSRKFVQTVHSRMRSLAPSVVVAGRINEIPRFWLLMGGLVSAVVLLAAVARAVFYVLNRSNKI
jgi:hypothetical protein